MLTIAEISNAVALVAKSYDIKQILLFGSYADGCSTSESDVDLLVEFYAPYVSLLTISSLKLQLEEILKKDVDIIRFPIPETSLINPENVVTVYAA